MTAVSVEIVTLQFRRIKLALLFCIAFSENCFQTNQQSCVQKVRLSCGASVCRKELIKKKPKSFVSTEMP